MSDIKDKIKASITEVKPRTNTFKNYTGSFTPTQVNFFYGRNGSGKSTIAREIRASYNVTFESGKTLSDYEILHYDQDYIDENFETYNNLPGRLIFHKANVEAIKKQDEIKEDIKVHTENMQHAKDSLSITNDERSMAIEAFRKQLWDHTAILRKTLPETLTGGRNSQHNLYDLYLKNNSTPKEHNYDDLLSEYKALYSEDHTPYPTIRFSPSDYKVGDLIGSELMGEMITGSAKTPYGEFIKTLNSLSWVESGFNDFVKHNRNNNHMCPFCMQVLPPTFENDLASCFDDNYKGKIKSLNIYKIDYEKKLDSAYKELDRILSLDIPYVKESSLSSKIALFKTWGEDSKRTIEIKVENPSLKFKLNNIDNILSEINDVINEINDKIEIYNENLDKKDERKKSLAKAVWEYISFLVEDDQKNLNTVLSDISKREKAENKLLITLTREMSSLYADLQEASGGGVPTENAVEKINILLKNSNFHGFELRPSEIENVYTVMRIEGDKATPVGKDLSEGEKNFIAFLYFFYTVIGDENEDKHKSRKPRIVIIDDPVSSMDDNALFIIGSLVKDLIRLCISSATLSEKDYGDAEIDQMFILTHNVLFHRNITKPFEGKAYFNNVSFFLVKKRDTDSSVDIKTIPTDTGQVENDNPVKNSYAILWREYKDLTSATALVNVMHQILEYYFIQLCGYDGERLRDKILDENDDKFFEKLADGSLDKADYHLADSFVSRITTSPAVISDDHLIEDETDIETYRNLFARIFRAMDQEQHYAMMTNEGP